MRPFWTAWVAVLSLAAPGFALAPPDLVPVRWPFEDTRSLELLAGTPVNCLLLPAGRTALAQAAASRGLVPLATLRPEEAADAATALSGPFHGVVLEGEFPPPVRSAIHAAAAKSGKLMVELTSRARLFTGESNGAVQGTGEGLWPGIQVLANGAAKSGPSGTPWIDTNGGFLRSLRARTGAALWIANRPPPATVLKVERYLQAVCDAAMAGARWVIALDDDFTRRLGARDESALRDWTRMMRHVAFFEERRAWRNLIACSKLAIVQDPADGPVLAAGVLDMISTRHTPARALAEDRLATGSLDGAKFAVTVNPERLTPPQKQVLQTFTRAGGTLLTGPTGWRSGTEIGKQDSDKLNDIWHEVQSMIGRRNMGARLFNVSSMLSNVLGDGTGKQMVVYLLNYSNYPVESVTVHLLEKYRRATLYTPENAPASLELYGTEEGTGMDIDKVSVFAAVYLEQ